VPFDADDGDNYVILILLTIANSSIILKKIVEKPFNDK
jgi:hypothetical protein